MDLQMAGKGYVVIGGTRDMGLAAARVLVRGDEPEPAYLHGEAPMSGYVLSYICTAN